ncbi:MAG: hypothetical protein GX893_07640 [Firmicutes bacterium]|nr:hypothetical protein [Bacillota bacterium]
MELKILHLYHDLLNLYGEVGNIKILTSLLMKQNIEVTVKSSSVGDDIEIGDYDFIYLGSGTEKNQLVALNDLSRFKNELREAVAQGVVMLATGNSFEIFGRFIREIDGEIYEGLNLFNFYAERSRARVTSDIIYSANFLEKSIVGFVNKKSMAYDIDNYLFKVKFGAGANESNKIEGVRENNFFGTYVIGPILVRNPHFLDYIARLICHAKDPNFAFNEIKNENQVKAYETALFELSKRMG